MKFWIKPLTIMTMAIGTCSPAMAVSDSTQFLLNQGERLAIDLNWTSDFEFGELRLSLNSIPGPATVSQIFLNSEQVAIGSVGNNNFFRLDKSPADDSFLPLPLIPYGWDRGDLPQGISSTTYFDGSFAGDVQARIVIHPLWAPDWAINPLNVDVHSIGLTLVDVSNGTRTPMAAPVSYAFTVLSPVPELNSIYSMSIGLVALACLRRRSRSPN